MKPTVAQVYTTAATYLGDPAQQFWGTGSPNNLQIFYVAAYRDMFRTLERYGIERARRQFFYNVPANTSFFDPASAGIVDFSEPESVGERDAIVSFNVSGATPGVNQLVLQVTGHSFTTGQNITVNNVGGISDDVNDIYTITKQDANNIILNGCTSTGTYTSGGVASFSNEDFTPMDSADSILTWTQTSLQRFQVYSYEDDRFRFPPCNQIRQLRIVYIISGNPPTTSNATIQLDDCLDYLATQTAYRAALSRDMALAANLGQDAGALLEVAIAGAVRNMARVGHRRPAFRPKRNQLALY